MGRQIIIEACWTDAPSAQLKNDFMGLANAVFGNFVTEAYYKAKFEDNIYGASLLTIVYVDGQPAGADVMWRNDLGGVKAYQTVDTCVLEPFRGMGLFKKITQWELETLGKDVLVYGFPNVNSYPGYVKMGWQVQHLYKAPTLLKKCSVPINDIESAYAAWWLKAQQGIIYIQKSGRYYLVRKKKNGSVATVIGGVDETTALLFPKSESICLFKRFETKPSFYNKSKSIPLVCNNGGMEIPYWKIDAV